MTRAQFLTRLDVLRANLEKLGAIPQQTFEEFIADFRNVAAALYLLQTSIQSLIDLGGYHVAQRSLKTPRTSHEIFEALEGAGCIPAGTAARMRGVIGFRNRIVHLYDRIDERRVYDLLANHRADLAEVMDVLLAIEDPDTADS